ncbi:MAG: DHH family phosphoesterase [Erysipelotrichaceae bacterium]|nr:DHH family phosphoesterase [Erysipelotrichaceae bacterium]
MNTKTKIVMLLTAVLLTSIGYMAGKTSGQSRILKQQQYLQMLNRSSVEKMVLDDGPIYVIGHKSPDSDTVCAAVSYARLLTMLGYDARPVISEEANRETEFIFKEAGIGLPEVLYDASGLNIFLVDHSEYAQAIEGMTDAHIVGILDHHGAGTVTTGHQIVYEARPIGSTATIVWLDYLNYGLDIDRTTAFLLLGAVLSDTDGLTGSTTTEADRQAVLTLAGLAEVADVNELYRQIHTEKLSYEGMTGEEILFSDYKEYEASGVTFGIGLVNAIDEDAARELAKTMKETLPEASKTKDVDLIYASVGIRENGEKIDYIIPGNELSKTILENAFPDYDEFDGTVYIFRSGLGRKTKFVPGLTDYLGAHPHE